MTNKLDKMLSEDPKVINIGLRSFFESCQTQGIKVVHIHWEPPAQGDNDLLDLLDKLL
ncbi:MAG: fdrA domain protein [Candidatus Hodarchaeales archaeon]|jgi:hypothetical protein